MLGFMACASRAKSRSGRCGCWHFLGRHCAWIASASKSVVNPVAIAPTPPSRPRFVLFGVIVLLVVGVDQLTKRWAVENLTGSEPKNVLGTFIQFTLYFNPGAAFGTGAGYTVLLSLVAIAACFVLVFLARQLRDPIWTVGLALFLGGALGNLFDRVFRPPGFMTGHVVDFISYNGWFVGNVADIALTGAAIIVVVRSWQGVRLDGTLEERRKPTKD